MRERRQLTVHYWNRETYHGTASMPRDQNDQNDQQHPQLSAFTLDELLDGSVHILEGLVDRVEALTADGNTNLYGVVCDTVETANRLRADDIESGESRLYGIVLLSDGEDTVGALTENRMFATCLPANAEADGIKIFPIAFGEGADQPVLERMASVTAGRLFTADPESISNVYISISAEQ